MKLNSFNAKGVQGYLNYDITFNAELTFLIGINGCGKTTALKLLLGMVSPSYEYLNEIEFDSARLVCSSRGQLRDIVISAERGEKPELFKLSLHVEGREDVTSTIHRTSRGDDEAYEDDLTVREQSRNEKFEALKITRAIRELATPKFLGLDRRVYEGRSIDYRVRNRRMMMRVRRQEGGRRHRSGASALDASLEEVQFLVFSYFRQIAYKQPEIGDRFKKEILSLSFNFIDDFNITAIPADDLAVRQKKEQVIQGIKDLKLEYLTDRANRFFDKMIEIVAANQELENRINQSGDDVPEEIEDERFKILRKWFNNSSQLKRVDEIIRGSQTYQKSLAELREPIQRFEGICSKFFKEGNKKIRVGEAGEIIVMLKGSKEASIHELSSGEKQIIIMIAHLIFNEDQSSGDVFIIDEPELSLHITWQEIFVDSILEASPKTQFILATHSPSIIAKVERDDLCQDVGKLNL